MHKVKAKYSAFDQQPIANTLIQDTKFHNKDCFYDGLSNNPSLKYKHSKR